MIFCKALPAFILLALLSLLKRSSAANITSSNTTETSPAPLVVPPSEGMAMTDHGLHFSFVGTLPQIVRVLVSTASNQPLVVVDQGCFPTDPSDCANNRGGIFQTNASSTWYVEPVCPSSPTASEASAFLVSFAFRISKERYKLMRLTVYIQDSNNITTEGIFSLTIEINLGLDANGQYGYDTVSLSYPGSGTPTLPNQLIGGVAAKDFFMGVFGVNPAESNLSTFNDPIPSYMSTLKAQNLIPSLSYTYTAGNQYRLNKVLGSLTLGGYDPSLVVPNDLTFDLTVNVNSISMTSSDGNKNLSYVSFPAFVDSTIPYLYLPTEVYKRFEEAFRITYDNSSRLYLLNSTLHTKLLEQAANVTFTLTNTTGNIFVYIILPYQAFDLKAKWPLVKNTTRYFLLKRAVNDSQTTLGRAFFEEAYLIADYERSNFSLYQRKLDSTAQPDIQSIHTPSNSTIISIKTPHFPVAAAFAGGVSGGVFITVLISCIIIIRQRNQRLKALNSCPPCSPPTTTPSTNSCEDLISPSSSSELDGEETQKMSPELGSTPARFGSLTAKVALHRHEVFELPAVEAARSELLGSLGRRQGKWG